MAEQKSWDKFFMSCILCYPIVELFEAVYYNYLMFRGVPKIDQRSKHFI